MPFCARVTKQYLINESFPFVIVSLKDFFRENRFIQFTILLFYLFNCLSVCYLAVPKTWHSSVQAHVCGADSSLLRGFCQVILPNLSNNSDGSGLGEAHPTRSAVDCG